MFAGRIQGIGPRYCPSIEDKINRFAERDRHQVFVEPEGWNTVEMYINGFSTSLPEQVQFDALRKIEGFEHAKMFRPGYAIEYDYFPPTQLKLSLETKTIEYLFFAGQINGTTGYEEAACQGLMAGINAHKKINQLPELILKRNEAYIGVLIDDLVSKGTQEPYRMFTSRAEYRILLRQDNADIRLSKIGFEMGLLPEENYRQVEEKIQSTEQIIHYLKNNSIVPDEANGYLNEIDSAQLTQKQKIETILLRPNVSLEGLARCNENLKKYLNTFDEDPKEQAEIVLKYASYIEKEQEIADKMGNLDSIRIYETFDYSKISSLSIEAKEKLSKLKPQNLGQASRVSGVSPADISVLLVFLKR